MDNQNNPIIITANLNNSVIEEIKNIQSQIGDNTIDSIELSIINITIINNGKNIDAAWFVYLSK